jgi:3-hydroxybutyryl-CoA dehydrogenase
MTRVGILGTGTMGGGIAQVAALHGCSVAVVDVSPDVVRRALDEIGKRLDRLVEKGKLPPDQRDRARDRLHPADGPDSLASCDLVIEAVTEDIDVKARLLRPVAAHAAPQTVIASNTSSLSITRLGRAIGLGRRTAGMHFFNPAHLMPLVEVIAGDDTDPDAVERVASLARSWDKTVVNARDTPGFIVNRVARGYYLEPLRMLGEGVAGVGEIDRIMKQHGGFRLGPFELMDLVGIDVNYGVSTSVWEQLGRPARLTPHPIQVDLRERGRLGRKTGQGFYDYTREPPVPAVAVDRRPLQLSGAVREAAEDFARRATSKPGAELENYVLARTLVTILNEASLLAEEGVASREDVDTAMKLGTNYPRGPLEWAEAIGPAACGKILEVLQAASPDGRFAPARLFARP